MSASRRRERGTVAIVVALSATMIFALCALGVDLGSAFARKRDIQTQADLATLAAAAQLPHSATSQPLIEQAANTFASKNLVAGQTTTLWNFADADRTNGFIEYIGKNKLRLLAPQSTVDFWLAPVAGLPDGMNVSAVAAAEIRSPGRGLPFFVSTTCGWGQQTILDQTSGSPTPPGYVPVLSPSSSPGASATIGSISPTSIPNGAGATNLTVTMAGNNNNNINAVAFTMEQPATGHEVVTPVTVSGNTITVAIPANVRNASDTRWWVRIRQGTNASNNKWSESSNAQQFDVGNPSPIAPAVGCDSKNSGNFGSLDLSRNDVNQPSRYLVENMAQSVQHDFEKYPAVPVVPCAGQPVAVTDNGTPTEGRKLNCLETDTGSDLAQKATDAFITGTAQGTPPRLGVATTPGCSPARNNSQRSISALSSDINNDVLSCFLDAGVTIGDVTQATIAAAHEHSISAAIFSSPRFFWIPVLVEDPSSGGSSSYPIVDFRAVFLTEQPDSATATNPQATADNGVTLSSNGRQIEKLRVRAINPRALPEFSVDLGDDNTVEYIGVGTKIVRLIE